MKWFSGWFHERSKMPLLAVFLNEAQFWEGGWSASRVVSCEPVACDLNPVRSLQFAGKGALRASNFMIVSFAWCCVFVPARNLLSEALSSQGIRSTNQWSDRRSDQQLSMSHASRFFMSVRLLCQQRWKSYHATLASLLHSTFRQLLIESLRFTKIAYFYTFCTFSSFSAPLNRSQIFTRKCDSCGVGKLWNKLFPAPKQLAVESCNSAEWLPQIFRQT